MEKIILWPEFEKNLAGFLKISQEPEADIFFTIGQDYPACLDIWCIPTAHTGTLIARQGSVSLLQCLELADLSRDLKIVLTAFVGDIYIIRL